ncbi:hypothetical protein GGQ88_000646 [Novosphingobium hassiacum]|uniref:Sulfatase N-terminal domain-containing protein n=1 Tax=Novosphingobium hassiacum TaxID=173676 RepID=A0A7W5ZTW9_9SPHN|nr:hypothetical protein [Novosphingobium hassiacum]
MADKLLIYLALLIGTLLLDAFVRPRSGRLGEPWLRSPAGTWLHSGLVTAVFGLFLTLCANAPASAALTLALVALFTTVSNAKRAMLGEALVFSDLALIGAVFRHPQFYLSALKPSQKLAIVVVALVAPALLWWMFVPELAGHIQGLLLLTAGIGAIWLSLRCPPWSRLATEPDAEADLARHGLIATLLLYRARWRQTDDPVPLAPIAGVADPHELAVIIQCESFADPAELFGDPALALPGLALAREDAWQWGNLLVGGFGAYTMRTEYGVLFGRNEDDLSFRRFDPFLTALGEATYALPNRLAGWRSVFVHPHDMRFYNREVIMRAGGFADLVGEDRFDPPSAGEGRYVTDAAMADAIADLAHAADEPTLLYAVTIENHGPWEAEAGNRPDDLKQGYLRLVRNSDAMLTKLMTELAGLRRPATLVFFGDHRPSIPGVSVPGGARHTPYVIVRIDAEGRCVRREGERTDLTPAQLHHAILGLLTNAPED